MALSHKEYQDIISYVWINKQSKEAFEISRRKIIAASKGGTALYLKGANEKFLWVPVDELLEQFYAKIKISKNYSS